MHIATKLRVWSMYLYACNDIWYATMYSLPVDMIQTPILRNDQMTPNMCVDAHCNRGIIMLEEWASSVQWSGHCHNNALNLKITNVHAHASTTPRVAVMNPWQHVTIMIPHIVATIFEQQRHKETLCSGASTSYTDKAKPHLTAFCAWDSSPHLPVTLM